MALLKFVDSLTLRAARARGATTIARCGTAAMRAAAVLCGAAAVIAGGCATSPTVAGIEDTRLIGSWRTAGGDATFTFTPTGLYTMTVHELARPVLGPYEWDQKAGVLTLQTRRESAICGDDPATYRVLLSDSTLTAEVDRDSCVIREKLLSKPLSRVSSK